MGKDELEEIFAALGPVTVRRMFSGQGIYVEGVIVAIEFGGELRLKADAASAREFADAGAAQWAYEGHRGVVMMPYWSIPDEALDDPNQMAYWVRLAYDAGLRSHAGQSPKGRRLRHQKA